jgi:hypothetical protein
MIANLEAFFVDTNNPMINDVQTLSEKIRQRRTQMLVHSYLYYVLDESVIDDDKWQEWANELVELQKQRKDIGFYDAAFDDWSGATGSHLPFELWIQKRAKDLLNAKINMYNN